MALIQYWKPSAVTAPRMPITSTIPPSGERFSPSASSIPWIGYGV